MNFFLRIFDFHFCRPLVDIYWHLLLKVASLVLPVLKPSREPGGGFCSFISTLGPEMKAASCFWETWNYNKILLKMAAKCLFGLMNVGRRRERGNKIATSEHSTERCSIKFYKLFRDHRPVEIKQPNSPLFLAFRHFIRRENSEIWYKRAPLGKNQIGKLLRTAADNTGIQRIGTKVSNHSVRKTSILKLLDANTPENFVAQLSGPKNTQSLHSVKSANKQHQRQMSYILSRTPQDAQKFLDLSDSHHLQENPTSNGELLTPEAVEHTTSINSLSVAQASLNQLRGPEGASDVNSQRFLPAQTSEAVLVANFKYSTTQWMSPTKGELKISGHRKR